MVRRTLGGGGFKPALKLDFRLKKDAKFSVDSAGACARAHAFGLTIGGRWDVLNKELYACR